MLDGEGERKRETDHGNALGHITCSVSGVGPGLDDDRGFRREFEGGDHVLDVGVGETCLLDLVRVFRVDVRVAALEDLLGCDLAIVQVDKKLPENFVDVRLDADSAGRPLSRGIGVGVFELEEGIQFLLERLAQSDDSKDARGVGELGPDDRTCLEIVSEWSVGK